MAGGKAFLRVLSCCIVATVSAASQSNNGAGPTTTVNVHIVPHTHDDVVGVVLPRWWRIFPAVDLLDWWLLSGYECS